MKIKWRKSFNGELWYGSTPTRYDGFWDLAWKVESEPISGSGGKGFRWVLSKFKPEVDGTAKGKTTSMAWDRIYSHLLADECKKMAVEIERGVYTIKENDDE